MSKSLYVICDLTESILYKKMFLNFILFGYKNPIDRFHALGFVVIVVAEAHAAIDFDPQN